MSEITNEAVIKVTADASGVEAGLRQVEAATARTGKNLENLSATAQKTGKSLDNLGGSAGLRTVGEGAGSAAGQVDRATKSMADSIQRATATMNSGAKGSAAYYEALANTRGLNVAALRPYLDQLDAVTKKTAQAAAAQRQLDAGNSFLSGLRAQADGIGKTASQLAALRAEQLGVADDARPLIEQLQAAEEAAGNAGNSISGFAAALAAAGASAGIASVVQLSDAYNGYIAQLKLATTGQSEFVKAQAFVQQIAASAQSDLSSTASLFASITKSTRDLGIAQSQVANITEVVSLGLKVSGASAAASGSAIYQLSQAFNMGVLRGEEFNAVNDASPRLMEALADGIGVPVGALRAMAEQGALTTEVLANALPRALKTLQGEAKSVETVGGAITVLKDKTMLLVGATAQSSGVVSVLSGGIKLLSDNLALVGGAMATVAAVKLGSTLASAASAAYASVAANNARLASNVAAARSDVAATASAAALANARLADARAAVLASQGSAALALTTNVLIPAQAKATAASAAHSAALAAQAAATGAASVATRVLNGVLALTGGPVGAVIALLGVAATIWGVWSSKAKEANDKVAQSTEESTAEMITRLDEQIAKLRERNALAATEPRIKALDGISEVDKDGLARAKAALDANKAAQAAVGTDARARMMLQLDEVELSGKYEAALGRVKALQGEVATAAARTRGERLDDWYSKNGSAAQRLAAELTELKKQFGAIPPEMEKLVRAKYVDKSATKVIADQGKAAKEYADLVDRINGKSLGVDADYADNLKTLFAGYSAGKQSLEAYVATVEAYIKQQPFAKQAEEARLKALEQLSKFQDEYSKGLEATSGVYAKRIADAEAEATRNEELASTYGMTKSAVEQLELARLEEQLAQRSTLGLTLDEIDSLEKLIDAKKRNASAVAAMEQVDAAKKAAEEWKRASDSIEQSLTDALLRGFESGKGFGENLVETLKNMFNTLVLRPVIQAALAPISGDVASMLSGGGQVPGASRTGTTPSLSESVANVYNTFKSGGGFEKSVAEGVQKGFDKVGLSSGSGTPGQAAQWAGRAGGTVAGYMVGSSINKGISNGYETGSGFMTAQKIGTAVASYFAGPVGGAIAGAIGGVINRAFGMKEKEILSTTLSGSLGASGFAGSIDTAWKQDGGWFRSDKSGVEKSAVDEILSKQLAGGYEALKAASADYAKTLGINADSIAARTQAMSIAFGKDDAANQKAIEDFFVGVGNTISTELLPSVAQFAKQGESASTTLERVSTGYALIEAALGSIGVEFGALGVQSIAARERLLDLVGGLDAFASGAAFFEQNFLSESERHAAALKQVRAELDAIGLSSVDTRAELAGVVRGLDLSSEAGAKQYASIMGLQEKFAQVYPLIDETAAATERAAEALKERATLQDELDQLIMSSAQLLGKQRAALDESNRSLFDQVQAVRSQQAAIEAMKQSAASLLGNVDSSFSVLQRVVDRQKKALQEDIQMRTEAVSKLKSMSDALRSTLDGMRTPEQQEADRSSARAEIGAALAIARAGGPLPDSDKLQRALAAIGNGPSTDGYATLQDYQRDLFGTQGDLGELARLTDGALTVEEKSLKTLEDQVKQYDLQLERQQELIDIAKGQSITGLSIEQTLFGVQAALEAAKANPIVSATSAISQAYQSSLGRAPDADGLKYWQDRAAGGISTGAIVDSIKASPEAQIQKLYQEVFGRTADAAGLSYWTDRLGGGISLGAIRDTFEESDEAKKKLRGFAVGTNRVPYDMPAMIHEDERIIPAADNRELMRRLASPAEGGASLAAEIRLLREEVALLRGAADRGANAAEKTADSTGQLADQFENASDGGNALRVEMID